MAVRITAGYGDPETWGPNLGHPNDPRTPTRWDDDGEDEEDGEDGEEND